MVIKSISDIRILFIYLLSLEGGGGLHTSNGRAEHIQIIITSAQEVDNLMPYQLRLLVKK